MQNGSDARLRRLHRGSGGAKEVRPDGRQTRHSGGGHGGEDPCRGRRSLSAAGRIPDRTHGLASARGDAQGAQARREVPGSRGRRALCGRTSRRQGIGGSGQGFQADPVGDHHDGRRWRDAVASSPGVRGNGILDDPLSHQHHLPRRAGDGARRRRSARRAAARDERGDDQGRVHEIGRTRLLAGLRGVARLPSVR